MTDEVRDRKVINESLALRAKYKTKRQAPRQNLKCSEIVPHPMNRGGEAIRATRAKALAEYWLLLVVDTAVVETVVDGTGNPATTFSDHSKANAGLYPDSK